MTRFRFNAVTSTGEQKSGALDAPSQTVAVARLQGQGLFPLEVEAEFGPVIPVRERMRRPHLRDVAVAIRSLASTVRANVPIERSLEIAAAGARGGLQTMINGVLDAIRGGAPLSGAFAAAGLLDKSHLNSLKAGESAGVLGDVLASIATHMQETLDTRKAVTSALVYPAVVMGFAALSLGVMVTVVLPQFEALFGANGNHLPLLPRLVLSGGRFVLDWWWLLALGLTGLAVAMRRALTIPIVRLNVDSLLLSLPLLGPTIAAAEGAAFASTLAMLIGNGVPMAAALEGAQGGISNRVFAGEVLTLCGQVRAGARLSFALTEAVHLPSLIANLSRVGEETGTLADMLRLAATSLTQDFKDRLERGLALLSPALTLLVGVMCGGMVAAVISAILTLNEVAL